MNNITREQIRDIYKQTAIKIVFAPELPCRIPVPAKDALCGQPTGTGRVVNINEVANLRWQNTGLKADDWILLPICQNCDDDLFGK